MKKFVYKSKQEAQLIQKLSMSGFISENQLLEIKKLYNTHVPYHNFLHVLTVAQGVLKLSKEHYTELEICSLFFAALFHDAGHTGTAQDLDEFRSLDLALSEIKKFEEKYDFIEIEYSIVRKSIIGTVFKNRAKNIDPYAILLADLDVSTVGMSFCEFLYFADFPFSIECGVGIKDWIKDVNYFKFLMGIDKNIFRSPEVRDIFPHYLENIRLYLSLDTEKIEKIFQYWKSHDITYEDFEIYFKENI